ncbi:MAG: ExeA family protein [Gammaproteobacteria bacterium]
MYAGYFGLQHDPFSIAPDPRYLFMSARHREALAHLLYGLQGSGGIVLLTGDIGTGKTTVFRCFLEQVPDSVQVAYVFNPKLSALELLQTICDEFGIEVSPAHPGPRTIKDHIDPLNVFLLALHAQGRQAMLVIDEAQNLSADVLEQLRLLTNLETAERKLLQIVLIGQPELRDLLQKPELEQLSQRIVARYHLQALSAQETGQYLAHRLGVAGWQGPLPMASRVIQRIHRLSQGVPRRINLLAGRAMLGAYATQRERITEAMVDQAAREIFDGRPEHPGGWRLTWRITLPALGLLLLVSLLLSLLALGWIKAPEWMQDKGGEPAALQPDPSPMAQPTTPEERSPTTATPAQAEGAPGDIDALFDAKLWQDEAPAWQALAPLWAWTPDPGTDPCKQTLGAGLQCFRSDRMTPEGLSRLNRPAILTVRLADRMPQRVLLTRQDADGQFWLAHASRQWRVSASELGRIWDGSYATLWRTPPGTRERIVDARLPEQRQWIDSRLVQLQQAGHIASTHNTYEQRLVAFQEKAGVETHGKASPMTLMQLNQATGVDEPVLVKAE